MFCLKKLLAPVLAGMLCAAAMPVPAAAEETAKQIMMPLYDDFVPVGDDMICVNVPKNRNVYVEITQHSPERANLMLYRITLIASDDPKFYFPVDPGDYTVTIGMSPADGGIASMKASADITIESADYSDGAYESSLATCNVRMSTAKSDQALAEPTVKAGMKVNLNSVREFANLFTFQCYARLTGDFTGNGEVDLDDAIGVMTEYNLREVAMVEEGLCSEEALGASDTDGDCKLTLNDAIAIMTYCNYVMMDMQPYWDEITPQA